MSTTHYVDLTPHLLKILSFILALVRIRNDTMNNNLWTLIDLVNLKRRISMKNLSPFRCYLATIMKHANTYMYIPIPKKWSHLNLPRTSSLLKMQFTTKIFFDFGFSNFFILHMNRLFYWWRQEDDLLLSVKRDFMNEHCLVT